MNPKAELPPDEAQRLQCLLALEVLDTAPEPLFDQATELAALACGVPIALVSLVDAGRQWFKSRVGLPDASQTPRDIAFCSHAILTDDLMEVADTAADPRFADNPLVLAAPHIRFYAGAPLVMPGGQRVGTLCVIDRVPRSLTPVQRGTLQGLARIVATTLAERSRHLALARQLEEAEARYRLIVEGQSELISIAHEDGTLTYVNPAYAQFFGAQPPDITGRNLIDLVAPPDRPAVAAHLQRVLAEGAVASDANRMVAADGQERWVAWSNRCLPARDGRPRAIHSVGRDITAQRQAEQALAANEARSRMLYEATPALLQSTDPQGRLVDVSDHWLQHMGYRRDEVIGRPAADFLTADSVRRAREEVLPGFMVTGRCDGIDHQMVRKDGSLIDIQLSAVLERDSQGQALRSLAVVQDVTERNRASAALKESSHLLQLVLDGLPARISYWDSARLNRFANKAFLLAYSVEQHDITGRHAQAVLGETAYAALEDAIGAGLLGHFGQLELPSVGADGAPRSADIRFIPDLRDGSVQGLLVFALDITAQRQAERELADRERRLKLLVDGVQGYAIYMLDTEGRVVTWNAGAQRVKRYAAEQVIGQSFDRFFTDQDRAAARPAWMLATAAREGRVETEGWRVRGDGQRFWAGVLLSAIHDESGQLVGFAKITRDLSQIKHQQTLLNRVVELAPCAMLMVDPQGRIVMVNAETEKTFGYARDELLGQPVDSLLPMTLRERHAGLRAGFIAQPSARTMGAGRALRARRRNGDEFPVEVGLSPIDGPDGTSTLAAVFDISERQRQQGLVEQALAEKETLLKEVYHRVKNNLQVVQSLLNLQRHVLPDGPARLALLQSVQRVRAMALVHEKLYQSGNLEAIALPAYTRDLIDQIAEAHGTDRAQIRFELDIAGFETGLDNAIPLGLLLTELVTNSLKHAFPLARGGWVRISLHRVEGGALLQVADNGVGYAAAKGAATPGASMGLQLASSLARQLGGDLKWRSGSGTGSVTEALLARL